MLSYQYLSSVISQKKSPDLWPLLQFLLHDFSIELSNYVLGYIFLDIRISHKKSTKSQLFKLFNYWQPKPDPQDSYVCIFPSSFLESKSCFSVSNAHTISVIFLAAAKIDLPLHHFIFFCHFSKLLFNHLDRFRHLVYDLKHQYYWLCFEHEVAVRQQGVQNFLAPFFTLQAAKLIIKPHVY